ncbi:MAG TPA: hypothetical protein DIT25_04355, partial [Candidatus Moranbacteria bacterium]|nr:hypothetical protein [Candidatus Moranbacteria bacterium]
LDTAETLMGRSACPHCKGKIRWYDNIPFFSFLILRAKCRECEKKISLLYPLVELGTGALFALSGYYFFSALDPQSWLETVFYLGIFSALVVIFAYDFKFMEIPMIVLWIGVGWTVAFLLIFDWMNFNPQMGILDSRIFSGVLAGSLAFLFFFALSAGSKEKWMGMGDAYLALFAGLAVGWPVILGAFMLAFALGSVSGIALLLLKKKTMKSQLPFAPFMALGIFLSIFIPLIFPGIKHWIFYF